jgi:hypothetical protein
MTMTVTSADSVFEMERLTVLFSQNKQSYTLYWRGECDFRNPAEVLSPMLNGILPELRDRRLILDFCELSFMNSTSVTPILAFVKDLCSKDIPVHLVYSSTLSWQRTTAFSMRALGHSLKQLSVEIQSASDSSR